jgi:hypothetical protein
MTSCTPDKFSISAVAVGIVVLADFFAFFFSFNFFAVVTALATSAEQQWRPCAACACRVAATRGEQFSYCCFDGVAATPPRRSPAHHWHGGKLYPLLQLLDVQQFV